MPRTPLWVRAILAAYELDSNYELLPACYRSAECRDGGALDMRPDDAGWP